MMVRQARDDAVTKQKVDGETAEKPRQLSQVTLIWVGDKRKTKQIKRGLSQPKRLIQSGKLEASTFPSKGSRSTAGVLSHPDGLF